MDDFISDDDMEKLEQSDHNEPGYADVVAQIESNNNPNAKNPKSSAKGKYQFIDRTAKAYGITNPFDEAQQDAAFNRFTDDNRNALKKVLGREPSNDELYLAHQQGSGGAAKLLKNPDAKAIDTVGYDAIVNNGGTADMTNRQFADKWLQQYRKKSGSLLGKGVEVASNDPTFAPTQTADGFISDEDMDKLDAKPEGFISDEDMAKLDTKPAAQASKVESVARGALQGATANFSDEAMAGIGALIGKGSDVFKSDQDKLFKDQSISDVYNDALKGSSDGLVKGTRADEANAEAANPNLYGGAQIAGAIVSPVNKLGLPAAGALMGAGTADNNGDILQDAAIGGAGGAVLGKVLPAAGRGIVNGLERYATSPLVSKIAQAAPTNAVPAISKQLNKAAGTMGFSVPQPIQNLLESKIGQFGSRAGAYHSPLAIPQAINDTQKLAGSLTQKLMDLSSSNPGALGKYLPNIQEAIKRGGNSLSSTTFIMQQNDPEFRELTRKLNDENSNQPQ